jgi:ABC-type transport system substrate-binding protein
VVVGIWSIADLSIGTQKGPLLLRLVPVVHRGGPARRGVHFQDGSEFTAADVAFSLHRVPLVPNSPSSFAIYLRPITAVEIVDPHTLRLHTAAPAPNLPINLSLIAIMSSHAAAGPAPEGKTTAQLNAGDGTVGTGPYRFVSFAPGDHIVLARNPSYWGGAEPWEKVTVVALTNGASRTAALLSGDVDIAALPASNYYARRNKGEFSALYQTSSIMTGTALDQLPIVFGTRDPARGFGQINFNGYSNPKVDALIDEANRTTDDAARSRLVQQASRLVNAEDFVVLPIYVERVAYGVRKPLIYAPRADKWITAMQVRMPK